MMDQLKGKVTAKEWRFVGVAAVLLVFLIVVFYFFLYSKKNREIEGVKLKDATVVQDLQTAREKQKGYDKLKKDADDVQALVDEFQKRLPSERELTTFLSTFEAMATEVGLEIELKALTPTEDARKETVPYAIKVFGDFHQIAGFVNRIERYERYLKVSDLEIKKEESGISEADFTLSTYRFLEQAKTRPKEQPKEAPKS